MRGTTEAYITYRRLIGFIGILLPFVLLVGVGVQESISACYYTAMQDIFVGALITAGVFLTLYTIYSLADNIISTIAGITGITTALFPMKNNLFQQVGFLQLPQNISGVIHYISAGTFFLCLAVMAFFFFTKSVGGMTERKRIRNVIYRISGIVIVLLILILAILGFAGIDMKNFTFIAETIMLLAFGVSWFIKGETILKDKGIIP